MNEGWTIDVLSGPMLATLAAAVLAGFLLARFLFRLGEGARHEALEAQCREEVKAAGVARDRNQAKVTEFESRLEKLREEHSGCDERIEKLERDLHMHEDRDLRLEVQELQGQLEELRGAAGAASEHAIQISEQNAKLEQQVDGLLESEGELERLQAAHAVCEKTIRALDKRAAEGERLRGELERATAELDERGARVVSLEAQLMKERQVLEADATEMRRRLETEVADVRQGLEARLAEVQKRLEGELDEARQAHAASAEQVQTLEARVATLERLEPQVEERDERIREQLLQIEQARERTAALDAQVDELGGSLDKVRAAQANDARELATRLDRIGALEETLRERDEELALGAPAWRLSAPQGEPDDLQSITGIGGVFETRLNELGIYHFHQLARLTSPETAWLALRLNTPPARIAQQKWVTQAKRLTSRRNKD